MKPSLPQDPEPEPSNPAAGDRVAEAILREQARFARVTRPGMVGRDGATQHRRICAAFPMVVEAPGAVEPSVPLAVFRALGDRWWDDPRLLNGALPAFRGALEGAIDICHTILLAAGWKSDVCELGYTHHAGATWRRGEELLSVQVVARNLPPTWMASEPSWKRRPRIPVLLVIEGQGEHSRPGFEGLLEGLAQHAEWSGEVGEGHDLGPAEETGPLREVFATGGHRLLEDLGFNRADPWFADCAQVIYGYHEVTDDPICTLRHQEMPRPWWERGRAGVPETLRKALGRLRGNVQLIRIGGLFDRREHEPTRLVVSGPMEASRHGLQHPDIQPGMVRVLARDPQTRRITLCYTAEAGEEIPLQVLKKLTASTDAYAERFIARAIRHSLVLGKGTEDHKAVKKGGKGTGKTG